MFVLLWGRPNMLNMPKCASGVVVGMGIPMGMDMGWVWGL